MLNLYCGEVVDISAESAVDLYVDFGVSVTCPRQEMELENSSSEYQGLLALETGSVNQSPYQTGTKISDMYVRNIDMMLSAMANASELLSASDC